MKPIVHGLALKYDGRLSVLFVDVNDERTLRARERFGIEVAPHLYLLDAKGGPVQSWVGTVEGDSVEAAVRRLLQ